MQSSQHQEYDRMEMRSDTIFPYFPAESSSSYSNTD